MKTTMKTMTTVGINNNNNNNNGRNKDKKEFMKESEEVQEKVLGYTLLFVSCQSISLIFC